MVENSVLVAGCIIAGVLAFIFIFACLYSIIKAFRDRRRIIEKNKNIRQQRLLSAESKLCGGLVLPPPPIIPEILEPEPSENEAEGATPRRIRLGSAPNIRVGRRGSAFAPPPEPEERRWEKEGLEYRAQGNTAHIHRTQSNEFKPSKEDEGATNAKGDRLKISEPGFRQRSASADIPRSILPSGEIDYRVGLLPNNDSSKVKFDQGVDGPATKSTIASTSDNPASALIKVTVTTHDIKEMKGWV